MKANKLINKLAIRTRPVKLGINSITGEILYDYSFTTSPIRILKVAENHIVYDLKNTSEEVIFGERTLVLDDRWIDDNWTDYEELISLKKDKYLEN